MRNKYTHEITVRFFDLDTNNHVNNSAYFTYMEEARMKILMEPYLICKEQGIHFVVVEANCKYRIPILLQDQVLIEVEVKNIGGASFDIFYKFVNGDGKIYAIGKTQMACFDDKKQRPVRLPENITQYLK